MLSLIASAGDLHKDDNFFPFIKYKNNSYILNEW